MGIKHDKCRVTLRLDYILWLLLTLHLGFLVLLRFALFNTEHCVSKSNMLDSYSPYMYPVMGSFNSSSRIKVGLIVGCFGPLGEGKHVMYDGISGSEFMDLAGVYQVNGLSNDEFGNVDLWVVDNVRVKKSMDEKIDVRVENILMNSTSPVLVIEFQDDPSGDYGYLMSMLGAAKAPRVRLAKRSIVVNRFLGKRSKIHLGEIQENNGTLGGPTLHTSYCVRNDIVHEIMSMRQTSSLWNKTRALDVIHLWNAHDTEYFSTYRSQISSLLDTMRGRIVAGRPIKSLTALQGDHSHTGRWIACPKYVAALLRSKIVVVTQRDRWEDSYRLMEALASGAMVLADTMLAPPPGIVDGIHLRFFTSKHDLKSLIAYYLQYEQDRIRIAHAGWVEAMSRHRAWHRMEELVFGKPLTGVDAQFPLSHLDHSFLPDVVIDKIG